MCDECREIEIGDRAEDVELENGEIHREKKEKVRFVDLSGLPRWESGYPVKSGTINWQKTIGHKIPFIYNDIIGELEIIGYNRKYLCIKYLDKELKISTGNLAKCKLKGLLKEYLLRSVYDETNPRRVDLRKVPFAGKGVDWHKTAKDKIKIPFVYDEIKGEIQIIDYKPKGQYLYIKYLDKDIFKINTGDLQRCKLQGLLKNELLKHDYDESNPKRIDLRNLPLNSYGIDWTRVAENKMKIPFAYGDINGELEIFEYNKDTEYLVIKYKDNNNIKIKTSSLVHCKIGSIIGKITSEFRIKIGDVFNDLIIVDKKYMPKKRKGGTIKYKYYKYTCRKCGYDEGWIEEANLLKGVGCTCCTNQTAVLGINTIWDTDKWMCDLGVREEDAKKYTKASGKRTEVVCPMCKTKKEIVISSIYRDKSISCICKDGLKYPEKFMFNMLNQIIKQNIIYQYSPQWCKFNFKNKIRRGFYDFYFELNDYKYIIETDGAWHKQDNTMNGQTKEESQFIDSEKDRLALEHRIEVIRINCEESELEFIKDNIIKSKLSVLFDLSIIDWDKCEEFALSNRVKEACELWNNKKEDETTKDICIIMKLQQKTVSRYLKKGNKYGWCFYDAKQEMIKSNIKSGRKNGRQIEMFKDGKHLGKFNNASELERQSKKIFGEKLIRNLILEVCNDRRETYKDFVFKYLDNKDK